MNIGDVVKLKVGGPTMVINSRPRLFSRKVECVYWEAPSIDKYTRTDGTITEHTNKGSFEGGFGWYPPILFRPEALELVNKET